MGDEDCSENEEDDEQGDNADSPSAGQETEGRMGLESWIQDSGTEMVGRQTSE